MRLCLQWEGFERPFRGGGGSFDLSNTPSVVVRTPKSLARRTRAESRVVYRPSSKKAKNQVQEWDLLYRNLRMTYKNNWSRQSKGHRVMNVEKTYLPTSLRCRVTPFSTKNSALNVTEISVRDRLTAVESGGLDVVDTISKHSMPFCRVCLNDNLKRPDVTNWRTWKHLLGRRRGTSNAGRTEKRAGTNSHIRTTTPASSAGMAGRTAIVHRRQIEVLTSELVPAGTTTITAILCAWFCLRQTKTIQRTKKG